MNGRCVLLFARSPEREGAAKGLYAERAVFELARGRVSLAAAGSNATLVVCGGGRAPDSAARLPQRGRTFGERLENALADARERGFAHVVVVPSDVPALSVEHLGAAFDALEAGLVPLGPSPDGGVYLIGVDTRRASSFEGVHWLTPAVCADLVALAGRDRVVLLAPLRDVDAPRDLASLAESLEPELRRLLRSLLPRVPRRPSRARLRAFALISGSRTSRAPPLALAA